MPKSPLLNQAREVIRLRPLAFAQKRLTLTG